MKRHLIVLAAILLGVGASKAGAPPTQPEQAVIVHFLYGKPDWKPFFAFEEKLEAAVNSSGFGEYDGNELANDGSDGFLYLYGPDAERLFTFVRPFLERNALLKSVEVTIRLGTADEPNVKQRVVKLGS